MCVCPQSNTKSNTAGSVKGHNCLHIHIYIYGQDNYAAILLLFCVCLHVCVFVCSYHLWGHFGSQIVDGLSKDAQGGENKHNPKDHTGSVTDRQAGVRC